MTRHQILSTAITTVTQDRNTQYGPPEDSFAAIADYWTSYLQQVGIATNPVSPHDVGMMMALLKVARIALGPAKGDNYVDLAGYAACAGGVATVGHDVPSEPVPLPEQPAPTCPGVLDYLYTWASQIGFQGNDQEILAAVRQARMLGSDYTMSQIRDWAARHGVGSKGMLLEPLMQIVKDAQEIPGPLPSTIP